MRIAGREDPTIHRTSSVVTTLQLACPPHGDRCKFSVVERTTEPSAPESLKVQASISASRPGRTPPFVRIPNRDPCLSGCPLARIAMRCPKWSCWTWRSISRARPASSRAAFGRASGQQTRQASGQFPFNDCKSFIQFVPGCPSVRFALAFVRTTGGGNVHEAPCFMVQSSSAHPGASSARFQTVARGR